MSTRRMYVLGLFVAASLCCVWVALAQTNRNTPAGPAADAKDAALRDLARLVVVHEVYKLHWTTLEPSQEFKPVIDQLSADLLPKRIENRWKVNVFPTRVPNEPAAGLDEFSRQAIAAIQRGEDEVWQVDAKAGVRFATAIRAKPNCIACHPVRIEGESQKVIAPNDIIGIVAIKMYPDDEMDPPDELRAAIENLRRVAIKYSHTKAAERILEVLNKLEEKQNK